VRSFLTLALTLSVLGCSDGDTVTFKSREPFDAVVVDGTTSSAYGLRIAGEERARLCSGCAVLGRSPAGDHALLAQGEQGFFIAEPGRVNEVFDLTSAAVDGAPAELAEMLQAVWSPDSKHMALIWGTSQAYVAAADGTGPAPVATGAVNATGYDDQNIIWSPDSSHVAFTLGEGVVAISDAEGGSILTLPPGSTAEQWSPDGGLFAFVNAGVSLVDASTQETRLISATATQSFGWSPDGGWFAYFDGGLVLAPTDDAEPVVVPLDGASTAQWSPVADELVYGGFLMRDGPGVDVVLGLWAPERSLSIPVDSEVSNRLPMEATWSPDGARFFYRLTGSESSAHYSLTDAAEGNELARFPAYYDPAPSFNRDGSLLAVTSTTVAHGSIDTDLSVSDASGTSNVAIASKVHEWQWLADGEHLVLVTERSVAIAGANGGELSTRLSVTDGAPIALVR
jgi:Tol biopolymer transport system component